MQTEPVRETVRNITPEEGLSMTWGDAEAYVLPAEVDRWEYIKQHTAIPFDALRKLKGFL
jgi:hypothetical protein